MQFDQIVLETRTAPSGGQLVITDIDYDPATGQLDVTWISEVGETYTVESTTGLVSFSSLTTGYPVGGATGTSTSFSTNVPHAGNPEFFVRVQKP